MKTLIASLVLSMTACAPAGGISSGWSWVGPPSTVQVGVVGDSLTWQAEHGSSSTTDPYYQRHYLTDEFNAHGWQARVAARSGADTRSLRYWGQWATAPDVIVMALGTNDRRWQPVAGMVPSGFPFQLHISQPNVVNYTTNTKFKGACVVLMGIVEFPNKWKHDVYGPYWNKWLRTLAAYKGWVFVDWWAIAQQHTEYFTADLLHMNSTGQAAYRREMVKGVEQCL